MTNRPPDACREHLFLTDAAGLSSVRASPRPLRGRRREDDLERGVLAVHMQVDEGDTNTVPVWTRYVREPVDAGVGDGAYRDAVAASSAGGEGRGGVGDRGRAVRDQKRGGAPGRDAHGIPIRPDRVWEVLREKGMAVRGVRNARLDFLGIPA